MSNSADQHAQQQYPGSNGFNEFEFQDPQQQQAITTTIYQQYLPGSQGQMQNHSDLWNAQVQAQGSYTTHTGTDGLNAQQQTFSDLMREISHKESEALHDAAALLAPATYGHQNSLNMYPPGLGGGTPATTTLLPSPANGRGRLNPTLPTTGQPQTTSATNSDIMFEMFPCEFCAASFSRKHDLERHRRGHNGEAPYVCEGCGTAFTRSDGRGRHWRLVPSCEQAHFEKGGRGKKRSGGPTGQNSTSN